MSAIENASRRRFLTGGIIAAGALVLGVRYYSRLSSGGKLPHDTNADHATLHPNVYLGIDPDGTVWLVASRSEMGTTSRTTLPLVVRRNARSGSNGAIHADSSRGSAVGCSGDGVRNRFARCSPPLDEPQSGLRRTRERCGEIASPQERGA